MLVRTGGTSPSICLGKPKQIAMSGYLAYMEAHPEENWTGHLEDTRIDVPGTKYFVPGAAFVGVERLEPKPTVINRGGQSWEDVIDRDSDVDLNDLELAGSETFVPGGFSRGTALRHVTVCERHGKKEIVIGEGGVLGPRFDAYLRDYDQTLLIVIVESYWGGFDVEAAFTGEFCATIAAREQDRAEERAASEDGRSSDTRAKAWRKHNKICQQNQHVMLLASTISKLVASGAVEVLGTIEEVMGTEREPLSFSTVTIEPLKPRVCLWSKEVNEGTENRPVRLEGLPMLRDLAMASQTGGGFGKCLDEQSG